jgi:hypothetical protein
MYLKIDKNPLNPLLQHSIIPIFQFNQLRWHSLISLTPAMRDRLGSPRRRLYEPEAQRTRFFRENK